MVTIKTDAQIKLMQEGGRITAGALKEVLKHVKPGVKTIDLDAIAQAYIKQNGGEASFKTVKGYKFATCININEGIVHGLPNQRKIKSGDLVKVDLGVFYKGLHTDLSDTVEVETTNHTRFLQTGKKALELAIKQCIAGNKVGDISYVIQEMVESGGYTVSRDLVGHGIGTRLHEDPLVPGHGTRGRGVELKSGMVLALEVIYQQGDWEIDYESDGWTIITKDKSLAGPFEHTVAITKGRPIVLTA